MKKFIYLPLLLLFIVSCNSKPSIQKYMVSKSEQPDFFSLDIGAGLLSTTTDSLSVEEKEALDSFKKLNILAFKLTDNNKATYAIEKEKVKTILKENPKYEELFRAGTGAEGITAYAIGEVEHINEAIFFGNHNDQGFIIIRLLGKDMNLGNLMGFMTLIGKSDLAEDQLMSLGKLFDTDVPTPKETFKD